MLTAILQFPQGHVSHPRAYAHESSIME